ncbi:MFS transporter [Photobacterium phosphoreum]
MGLGNLMLKNLFDRRGLDWIFLSSSITSTAIVPFIILFYTGNILSVENSISLGVLYFWGTTLFSHPVKKLALNGNLKKVMLISSYLRLLAFFLLIFSESYFSLLIITLLSCLSKSTFNISSKLYLKSQPGDISNSLSRRFTIYNIGAAISPLLIFIIIYFDLGVIPFAAIMSLLLITSTLSVNKLHFYKRTSENAIDKTNPTMNKMKLTFIISSSILFSFLYFGFDNILAAEMSTKNMKEIYTILMVINASLIILLQIPIYKYVTNKIGDELAIISAFIVVMIMSMPIIFYFNFITAFLFVLSITYAEIFYATSIDTIILKGTSEKEAANYMVFSSYSISIGVSFIGWFYNDLSIMFTLVAILITFVTYSGLITYRNKNVKRSIS